MITIDILRLLLDFGLLVLIWIVQLVIYPGLCYYEQRDLGTWHKSYTSRIGMIVAPLMILQLVVVLFQVFRDLNWYSLGSGILVLVLWLLTFLIFVPLHGKIRPEVPCDEITEKLVRKNWWRTFLWSSLFIWTLLRLL